MNLPECLSEKDVFELCPGLEACVDSIRIHAGPGEYLAPEWRSKWDNEGWWEWAPDDDHSVRICVLHCRHPSPVVDIDIWVRCPTCNQWPDSSGEPVPTVALCDRLGRLLASLY